MNSNHATQKYFQNRNFSRIQGFVQYVQTSGLTPSNCCSEIRRGEEKEGFNAGHCDRTNVPRTVFVGGDSYDSRSVPRPGLRTLEPQPEPRAARICFRPSADQIEEPRTLRERALSPLKQFGKRFAGSRWPPELPGK